MLICVNIFIFHPKFRAEAAKKCWLKRNPCLSEPKNWKLISQRCQFLARQIKSFLPSCENKIKIFYRFSGISVYNRRLLRPSHFKFNRFHIWDKVGWKWSMILIPRQKFSRDSYFAVSNNTLHSSEVGGWKNNYTFLL